MGRYFTVMTSSRSILVSSSSVVMTSLVLVLWMLSVDDGHVNVASDSPDGTWFRLSSGS